jgi:hypothetical protein
MLNVRSTLPEVGMETDRLRDLIIAHSPKGFWQEISLRQEGLYNEAYSLSHQEALWKKPEADTVLPVVRRALFESTIRNAARANALKPFDMMHAGDNYPYVQVRTRRLIITAHYVPAPGHFVRFAESRKQNAAVNGWVDTYARQELLLKPLPKLGSTGAIYLYLLHGQFRDIENGKAIFRPFLQIAIPDAELEIYRKVYEVRDLLMLYVQREAAAQVNVAISDKAIPRIKKAGAE